MERDLKIAQVEVSHSVTQVVSMESSESLTPDSPIVRSNRIVICKHTSCNDVATSKDFCRLHYLANWKKVKTKEAKNQGMGLDTYMKELSTRFPDEFFEKLRADVEEMSTEAGTEAEESSDAMGRGMFDVESDEDMDDIMKGIRIEDY